MCGRFCNTCQHPYLVLLSYPCLLDPLLDLLHLTWTHQVHSGTLPITPDSACPVLLPTHVLWPVPDPIGPSYFTALAPSFLGSHCIATRPRSSPIAWPHPPLPPG